MLFMHWWHIVWLMLTCQMTAAAIATSTLHLAGVDGSEDKLLATDQRFYSRERFSWRLTCTLLGWKA